MIVIKETPKPVSDWFAKQIQRQIELRGLPPRVEIQSPELLPNLRDIETKIRKCHYE